MRENSIPVAPLRRRLLAWFDGARRPMPWREDPSPYRVLVSELMLQQTQVNTVLPYFLRFVERFPDLAALATAEEEEVLALWSGLGYYRRARNLHRAARVVLEASGGALPDTAEQLARLPGVGRYTAAAVASIAFGRPEAALDGNGIRVLTRLFALPGDPARQPLRERLWGELQRLVSGGERPGDMNQAVMELGARVCRPRNPLCADCPLKSRCRALAQGEAIAYPQTRRSPAPLELTLEVGIFRRDDKLLLCRGPRPFLGEVWNLPYRVIEGGGQFPPERWRRLGLKLNRRRRLGERRHGITRYRIIQRAVGAEVELLAAEGAPEYRWASPRSRSRLGLPSFTTGLLDSLDL